MTKIFKVLDYIYRLFGYCIVFEIDDENHNIKNILIKKTSLYK